MSMRFWVRKVHALSPAHTFAISFSLTATTHLVVCFAYFWKLLLRKCQHHHTIAADAGGGGFLHRFCIYSLLLLLLLPVGVEKRLELLRDYKIILRFFSLSSVPYRNEAFAVILCCLRLYTGIHFVWYRNYKLASWQLILWNGKQRKKQTKRALNVWTVLKIRPALLPSSPPPPQRHCHSPNMKDACDCVHPTTRPTSND